MWAANWYLVGESSAQATYLNVNNKLSLAVIEQKLDLTISYTKLSLKKATRSQMRAISNELRIKGVIK